MPFLSALVVSIALTGPPTLPPALPSGLASSLATDPPPVAPAAAPSLRFAPETLDLGEMISGQPKTGKLTVTNLTNAPLSIVKIVGACGCTTIAGTPTQPVAAGGSFTVQITVDPGAKTGVDLVKAVHFQFDQSAGSSQPQVQSMNVRGHVKTVVRVSPDVVDATILPEGADAIVTLESVDKLSFAITAIEPSSFVQVPEGSRAEHRLTLDWKKWVTAGRPAKLTVTTNKTDATTLVIPIRAAPAVAMFRLPAASAESPQRIAIERSQDAVILAIDAGFAGSAHSGEFSVKIHRETGMLFVHGTQADVATVRATIAALPVTDGVRESTN